MLTHDFLQYVADGCVRWHWGAGGTFDREFEVLGHRRSKVGRLLYEGGLLSLNEHSPIVELTYEGHRALQNKVVLPRD